MVEYTYLIITVPEPEAIDARACDKLVERLTQLPNETYLYISLTLVSCLYFSSGTIIKLL